MTRGIEAHVESINAQGGLNGRKVDLTIKDDQSDPTRAVTILQQSLDEGPTPDLVIPGLGSNEAVAMAPTLTRQKIVGMSAATSNVLDSVSKFPYYFSIVSPPENQVEAAAKFIADHDDVDKVALVVPDDALGEAIHEYFPDAFAGVETKTFRFNADSVDVSPVFQKAKSWGADWIYLDGAGDQVPHMLSGRIKAQAETIPTIGGNSVAAAPLEEFLGKPELEELYVAIVPGQAYMEPADRGDQFDEALAAIKKKGKIELPLNVYLAGWDLIGLWSSAISQIDGDVTGDSLKEALEDLPESDDPQFPLFSISYSGESHFRAAGADDYRFGILAGSEDGMRKVK